MPALTQKRLQEVLTTELKLRDPEFRLRRSGDRIIGSVISTSFKGKGDLARQNRIGDALEKAFGKQSNRLVGMLLAFTPDEWNIDLEAFHPPHAPGKRSLSKSKK